MNGTYYFLSWAAAALLMLADNATASSLPTGFREVVVISGREQPTSVRFAANGQVFIAEKSGLLWAYDSVDDPSATLVTDLREQVHNFWDRGLLGLAVSPGYPADGRLYVFYTHNVDAGGAGPRWADSDPTADPCPNPPGATNDGCVVYARLSRIDVDATTMQGVEAPLIQGNWCQQYPGHSAGDLIFGEDGYLYLGSGDGASFKFADWGQDGSPVNPCDDPPDGIGGPNDGPDAQGGALRSQDILTPNDPTAFNGSILRMDLSTGAPQVPQDNPLIGNGVPDDDFVIATGLRNPFRMNKRPGTSELWIADVGWDTWEEIDVVTSPASPVEDFGWPCYEGDNDGNARVDAFDQQDLCQMLYDGDQPDGIDATAPFYAYMHGTRVASGDGCGTGGSAITGIAFNEGNNYPPEYEDALYFADSTRDCIWTMFADQAGNPDKNNIAALVSNAARVVDLQVGPDDNLYYVDFDGGRVFRIEYFLANSPPTAVVEANPTNGPAPLTVDFDGSGSSDPEDGGNLDFSWDLDGDGAFDDSMAMSPSWTYTVDGAHIARLRVTDTQGRSDESSVIITAGNSSPRPAILEPLPSKLWTVGELITFSGIADDDQDGALPASQFVWDLILHHCTSLTDCHTHDVTTFDGVTAGSFDAPDHEFPSFLELTLTVQDLSQNALSATTSVRFDPQTALITITSEPEGLSLTIGAHTETTPFVEEVIIGSMNTVSAPEVQMMGGREYRFLAWSDAGQPSHNFSAGTADATLTATYELVGESPGPQPTNPPASSSGSGGMSPLGVLSVILLLLLRIFVRRSWA